jgi:hypothetical protein
LVAQHLRPQEWIELPGPGSNLSARLLVEGAGFAASSMKARVELDVGPSLLAGLPLERAYGNITVQDGRAVVTDLSAAALGGELDGSGSLDRDGRVAVHLRASVPDVASAEPWVPRSVGRLSGGAELRLDAEALLPLKELSALAKRSPQQLWAQLGPALKVALALRGDRLAAGDRQVGRLALLVNKEAGAQVPLDASLQLEQVQAGGLREGRTKVKARLVGRELDLSVSGSAAGGLSLEMAAGASLAEEEVAVRLRSFSASREQLAVNLVGEGRAGVTLADGLRPVGFSLAPLQLAVGPGVVEASGSWEESGALAGRLTAKRVDLRALGLALAGEQSVGDFAGFLDLDAGLGGSLSAPTGQLTVGLSEISARGLGPYGAKLTANYAPGRMRAEFGLSEGDASRLSASCELPVTVDSGTGQLVWSARRPMEAHWKLEPLALAPFAAAAGLPVTEVAGSLRGEGTVRGRLDALDVTGALTGEGLGGTVSQRGVAVRFEGIKTWPASPTSPPERAAGGAGVGWTAPALPLARHRARQAPRARQGRPPNRRPPPAARLAPRLPEPPRRRRRRLRLGRTAAAAQ